MNGHGETETGLAAIGSITMTGGQITGASRCATTRSVVVESRVQLNGVRVAGNGMNEPCTDPGLPRLRLPMSPN